MMNKKYKISILIAAKIWICTSLALGTLGVIGMVWLVGGGVRGAMEILKLPLLITATAGIGSIPVFIALIFILPFIQKLNKSFQYRMIWLITICLMAAICYATLGAYITSGENSTDDMYNDNAWTGFITNIIIYTAVLFACTCIAVLLNIKAIQIYFNTTSISFFNYNQHYSSPQINTNMDTTINPESNVSLNNESFSDPSPSSSNKILIKGIITGVLILVMLIPTIFLSNLVVEREDRQKEVVREVSSKWAMPQTITGPYLYIPYTVNERTAEGKEVLIQKQLFIFPDNINVTGEILPEQRLRSIYRVLLYKSVLNSNGNFNFQLPKDIDPSVLQWSEAKVCIGINDFKGIEEKLSINFNNHIYELAPGLPTGIINSHGLSSPINLSIADVNRLIAFTMQLKINGSEQLHFVPLSGNSSYTLHSTWANPSFDGNTLPKQRTVTDSGFTAKWSFNAANLPFGTVVKQFDFDKNSIAFGVSMLQPADQYAKTMRSVKYGILFIGLTFALFFIIELMQKKPLHPIQYVLVGFALVIFYSLLLSISEFILFNYAYGIASLATILLITLYAKSHFNSLKTASLFTAVLTALYGFIFVLIQLEDTALLVGSIGLFIVLALVMYASRKINWYGSKIKSNDSVITSS
ncbi:MAG TPA: cell envelope integrity protein CreD [Chitinophagaceae bacterium]|nr:cell envelope integrity protein CreD [Chitinophagaceae bacterium]